MNAQKQQKGFTIIEVVLVLAIAGLIFLMIFIALPALQRGQRDTQRRDDASRFITQLNSYSTNNNGRIPTYEQLTETGGFADRYLKIKDGEFKDPQTGDNYGFTEDEPDTQTFQYATGFKCDGEELTAATGTRIAAVRIELEGSGVFCQDNQ